MDKILMHGSIFKSSNGKYMSVLSDDGIDREDEIIGKSFFESSIQKKSRIRMMLNHENDVLMRIGDWTNQRIEKVKGQNALVAEPKFFKSNPKSEIIKGMLDEGAELDLSIGAMPTKADEVERNGQMYKRYTDGEILEASYVGIGANKNSTSMRIAKSLGLLTKSKTNDDPDLKPQDGKTEEDSADAQSKKNLEGIKVEKEELQDMLKSFKQEIIKEVSEIKTEAEETKPVEKPSEEPAKEEPVETETEKSLKLANDDLNKKITELESLYKAKHEEKAEEMEDLSKMLPVMR